MFLSAASSDYVSLNEAITFQPAANMQTECTPVTVIDDAILESEERFLISLETTDPRVILTMENTIASVSITDNDEGTFIAACYYVYLCITSCTVFSGLQVLSLPV